MFDKELYNNNCYYEVEVKKYNITATSNVDKGMFFRQKWLCDNVTPLNHNLAKK
jgi:hypothetical protein